MRLIASAETAAKVYFHGTHRARPPGEMLELIRPLARLAGVTRLANISGLDRIGLPTFSAVRPNARTLAVASGKGLTEDAARVSALMEAIELFHAEEACPAEIQASAAELVGDEVACDPSELPLVRHAAPDRNARLNWVAGYDLLQRRDLYVPTDVVLLTRSSAVLQTFVQSSNGLASGCVRAEALASALLEVVERDAIACQRLLARRTGRGFPRVRLESAGAMPLVGNVLDRLQRAEVRPIVYDLAVDTRIPVYAVYVYDATSRHQGIFFGSGAHLDPEIALLRALTEAAQSRLVYLAGTRDDFTSRQLAGLQLQDTPALIHELESQPESTDLTDSRSIATPTFDADIALILERLETVGVRHVVAVALTFREFEHALAVERVVVPGLEGFDLRGSTESARARRFADKAVA